MNKTDKYKKLYNSIKECNENGITTESLTEMLLVECKTINELLDFANINNIYIRSKHDKKYNIAWFLISEIKPELWLNEFSKYFK